MNENLNLEKILKYRQKGTKLYSPAFGEVDFAGINYYDRTYPIMVKTKDGTGTFSFTEQGKLYDIKQSECMLFPSREQRDWSKFKSIRPKFDPKTLQPFDKVLVRDNEEGRWVCSFYSHDREYGETLYRYMSTNNAYRYCIPYNDDTKHLVGTSKEAPEFYRFWEE